MNKPQKFDTLTQTEKWGKRGLAAALGAVVGSLVTYGTMRGNGPTQQAATPGTKTNDLMSLSVDAAAPRGFE